MEKMRVRSVADLVRLAEELDGGGAGARGPRAATEAALAYRRP
jgi:hypothetical protein